MSDTTPNAASNHLAACNSISDILAEQRRRITVLEQNAIDTSRELNEVTKQLDAALQQVETLTRENSEVMRDLRVVREHAERMESARDAALDQVAGMRAAMEKCLHKLKEYADDDEAARGEGGGCYGNPEGEIADAVECAESALSTPGESLPSVRAEAVREAVRHFEQMRDSSTADIRRLTGQEPDYVFTTAFNLFISQLTAIADGKVDMSQYTNQENINAR